MIIVLLINILRNNFALTEDYFADIVDFQIEATECCGPITGSEAAEQSMNLASKILREKASKQDCYLSNRMSPGFGDWPIEASRQILNYIGGDKIDIALRDEGILNPRKSITAIQAWIPD